MVTYDTTFYKNGTIGLPPEIINKLNLKQGDKLIIESKHKGFVVCRIEDYSLGLLERLEMELLEADAEFRQTISKRINNLIKKVNKESSKDKQETEVL